MNKRKKQIFDYLVTKYRKNNVTGQLEELPDKVDIFDKIQSSKEYALDKILDRYLPDLGINGVHRVIHQRNVDDLDALNEALAIREDMCAEYGLNPHITIDELSKFIKNKILKQEVIKDEAQENINEEIEKDVPENGEKGA